MKTAAIAGTALLALTASGCSQSVAQDGAVVESSVSFEPGTSMQEIADRGSIRIGTKFDLPTIGAKNLKGEVEGFDVEIAKMIAGQLGIGPEKIEWVETVSANREPYLQQKKVDLVVAYYAITPKRQEVVTFAGPYLAGGLDLLVKAGNPEGIHGPEDTAGKKVCGQSGSTGPAFLHKEYPEAELVEFDTLSKCVDSLKQGQVDAVVQADHVLLGAMEKEAGTFELAGTRFDPTEFGVGISKGDVEMCKFVEQVLQESMDTGTYDKAWKETIGKALEGEPVPEHPTLMPCE